jgi:hypothetical protein
VTAIRIDSRLNGLRPGFDVATSARRGRDGAIVIAPILARFGVSS